WFGFIGFFDAYGIEKYNDGFFHLKIIKLYNQDKGLFEKVFTNLTNLLTNSKNELLTKYPDQTNSINDVYSILTQCIETIKNVKKFRYIQTTASSRNMLMMGGQHPSFDYKYKYKKYKSKYRLLNKM